MDYYRTNELYHHGILGMKWGVRRYQNPDGSLTEAGQRRYYGRSDRIQRDIDSFKGHEKTGLYTKSGRQVMSSKEVNDSIKGLERARDNARAKGDDKRAKDALKLNSTGRYGSRKYFRPDDFSQHSKNWQINRMGGRKINADYETRRKRGEKLVRAGRTNAGAVGRYFGRNIIYGIGTGIAISAINSVGKYAYQNGNYGVFSGATAATAILQGAAGLYTVSNIIKTYQDISDMNTYRDSKSQKRK